jgi:hypothetical protein
MLVKPVHPEKDSVPRSTISDENFTVFRLVLPLNVQSPILVTVYPPNVAGTVTSSLVPLYLLVTADPSETEYSHSPSVSAHDESVKNKRSVTQTLLIFNSVFFFILFKIFIVINSFKNILPI